MRTSTDHPTAPAPVRYVDYPVRIRTVQVLATHWLTPTMIRLTAGGPAAVGFESGIFDEHVKIIFADPDSGELRLPTPDGDELTWPRPFPTSREYTVRAHRAEAGEIDIDFVVHRGGLASDWVCAAQPGDPVHIAGPPGGYAISDDYDFYLLAGDETALPAVARWLAQAPADRVGQVIMSVDDERSRQPLPGPPGVAIRWVVADDAAATAFVAATRGTVIPAGARPFVWLAGEAGAIKPLRRWVRGELGLGAEHSSITGYWKRGLADTHEHLDDDEDDEDA